MKDAVFVLTDGETLAAALAQLQQLQQTVKEPEEQAGENLSLCREILTLFLNTPDRWTSLRLVLKKRPRRVVIRISASGEAIDIFGHRSMASHFRERVSHRYFKGVNHIDINRLYPARRDTRITACCLLAAAVAGILLRCCCPAEVWQQLIDGYLEPLETLFVNAMRMIAPPVTMLCFICTLTGANEAMSRDIDIRRIVIKMVLTSLLALAVGLLLSELYTALLPLTAADLMLRVQDDTTLLSSFPEFVRSMLPDNILATFTDRSPLPLILLSTLLGISMCRPGKYHRKMLEGADTLRDVTCGALQIIYSLKPLPFFCAALHLILLGGARTCGLLLLVFAFIAAGLCIVMATYLMFLRRSGLRPIALLRYLRDVLRENIRISSNIDAVHYNIRLLKNRLGISHKFLRDALNMGAQQNMDGNCVCLMFFAVLAIRLTDIPLSPAAALFLLMVIIFLSFGSPNMPGSMIIGTTVIFEFLGLSRDYACVSIVAEVLTGRLIAVANTVGDITITLSEARRTGQLHTDADIFILRKP